MDFFKWLLGILVVLLIVVIALWIGDEPALSTGQVHPVYKTMLKSGPSVVSQSASKWLGYAFGLLVILVFGVTIFIGAIRKGGIGVIRFWLFGGMILYVMAYHFTVTSYWAYAGEMTTSYFLGVPSPTAWMIYALWSVPTIMTLVYVIKFNDWIMPPKDLERFNELVKEE